MWKNELVETRSDKSFAEEDVRKYSQESLWIGTRKTSGISFK